MSKKPRKVNGLLDAVVSESAGEEWEVAEHSPEFVPGMGLGATKQAIRWAYLGMLQEDRAILKRVFKKPLGRPKKHPYQGKDAIRAFAAWRMCGGLRDVLDKPNGIITNRELIRVISLLEDRLGVPRRERLFTAYESTNEQSLSRGKKTLEIDDNWNSKVCDKLLQEFSSNDDIK